MEINGIRRRSVSFSIALTEPRPLDVSGDPLFIPIGAGGSAITYGALCYISVEGLNFFFDKKGFSACPFAPSNKLNVGGEAEA